MAELVTLPKTLLKACIEPIAQKIVLRSLDLTLKAATGPLPTVSAVRDAFAEMPLCQVAVLEAPAKTQPTLKEAVALAKTPQEVLDVVKGNPILEAIVRNAMAGTPTTSLPEPLPERKKPGGVSPLWGKVFLHTPEKGFITGENVPAGEYSSPGALADALGIKEEPRAKTQVIRFERAGFEVKGNGEKKPFKTEEGIGFHVRRVLPTPREWRDVKKVAEFEGPGVSSLLPFITDIREEE